VTNSVFYWLALFLVPSAVWFLLQQRAKRLAEAANLDLPDLDAEVLSEMAAAGLDLSKEQRLEFYLVLPTERAARDAAVQLGSMGFETEAISAEPEASWVCLATRPMVPKLEYLKNLREHFNAIATSLGGQYDGWGSPVGEPTN
jgi:cbb3-type cytochrome oxidase subunit 3